MSKHQEPEVINRILGGFFGALTGAIWAFLRTWIASANSFNQLERGLAIVGILLGWIPGILAAIAGLFYGAYQGEKQGLVDGVLSVLVGIEIFIRSFEENSKKTSVDRRPLDWQRLELLPVAQSMRPKRNKVK